jgi:hypothetical protein
LYRSVKYDGEHYMVEAKWQEASAANEGVYQFSMKVEGKMYGRGLFSYALDVAYPARLRDVLLSCLHLTP